MWRSLLDLFGQDNLSGSESIIAKLAFASGFIPWGMGMKLPREQKSAVKPRYSVQFSCSVLSDSFVTPWTIAHQAPLSTGFPGLIQMNVWQNPPQYCKVISLQLKKERKKIGVGWHFLFQSIFLTQRLNPCLPLGRRILYYWATWTGFEMFQLGVTRQSWILRLWSCCHKCPWRSPLPSFPSFHPLLFLNVNNLKF